MYIGEPVNAWEPDLLLGNEHCEVTFYYALSTCIQRHQAPRSGWSHASLNACYQNQARALAHDNEAFDMYLGDQWVGGSEV